MFLSVSVPIYNAEKYLDRCIESIANQEFDDYEIILVDDGSIDNSLAICKMWKNKYPNLIRVIENENRGSLLTRRTCIKESTGDYLYIMDADDYLIDHHFFRSVKEKIEENKCDLLLFNATTGDCSQKYYRYPFSDGEVFEGKSLRKLYKVAIEGDTLNSLWCKIFHRNLIDIDVDYSSFPHLTNGTDMFQMIPILFNSRKAIYWDKVAYYYQLSSNENSIVHKFKPTIYLSLRECLIRLREYCNEWAKEDGTVYDSLKIRMLKIASTSAYKVRLLSNKKWYIAKEYISSIGNDDVFRNSYDRKLLKTLPWPRKIIVFLLYMRWYSLLILLIRLWTK